MDEVIARGRVIQAYRVFIKARKPMAAFAASDLAAWKYWDAVPEYIGLLGWRVPPSTGILALWNVEYQ